MIVGVEQIITNARQQLRLLDTQENSEYLQKLIERCARYKLNSSNTYTIQCFESDIDCLKAKLPDEYESLAFFQLNGGCSCGCNSAIDALPEPHPPASLYCNTCPSVYYYDKAAMINTGNCGWFGNYFYIQGGYIHFPSTTSATSIKIWYRGYNVNEEGLMLIDEESEESIVNYVSWQYALTFPEAYTNEQRREWKNTFWGMKGVVEGKRVIREFKLQKPQIALLANALLANNRRGGLGG